MSSFTGQRVLVTGAAGFIGSHLIERLAAEGAQVRAFLRYDSQSRIGNLAFLPDDMRAQLEIVRGDLKDPEAVRAAVEGCAIVFHLGALIGIPYSYQNPTDYVQTNVVGTMHVLNACRDAGVARLIQTSTSEVYGSAQFVPITLAHPRCGQSPYAASKIAADALSESYARAFGLPVVTLRPFNTYGPRQSPRAVIPTIVRQALAGDTVRIGATTPTRDFLYVADTVSGFIACATADLAPGTELQIGTGVEIAIGDIITGVETIVGKRLRVITDETRVRPEASEVSRLLCDATLARETLGWSALTSFSEGLREVVEWMEKQSTAEHQPEVRDYVR